MPAVTVDTRLSDDKAKLAHDAVAERVVSHPDSLDPNRVIHSIYLVGQPRWQPPRVQAIVGNLPDEVRVLRIARTDCRGVLRVLFDPDTVHVSGDITNADVTHRRAISSHRTRTREVLETPQVSTGRLKGRTGHRSMGDVITDTLRTNESQQGDVLVSEKKGRGFDTGGPRDSRSHSMCSHEKTKLARTRCRRARQTR